MGGTDRIGGGQDESLAELKAGVAEGGESVGLSFTEPKLQSQLAKHGGDWGMGGASNTTAAREEFMSALVDHVDSPGTTVIEGTFRGAPVVHFVDPESGLNVITTPEGGFLGAWRLTPTQIERVLFTGSLGME